MLLLRNQYISRSQSASAPINTHSLVDSFESEISVVAYSPTASSPTEGKTMSKVIAWFEGGNILKTDCVHFFETDVQVDTGVEVVCPVCAEVKAARVETLKTAIELGLHSKNPVKGMVSLLAAIEATK
ncbi:hypothetical protein LCGC14_0428480 [marine sediment metagenome]|uniref:Uncharacterized protein n=1 Tax=marine sediment metagenome TaxID=412755 RepID=A0A0F9VY94_9ZZZZ